MSKSTKEDVTTEEVIEQDPSTEASSESARVFHIDDAAASIAKAGRGKGNGVFARGRERIAALLPEVGNATFTADIEHDLGLKQRRPVVIGMVNRDPQKRFEMRNIDGRSIVVRVA